MPPPPTLIKSRFELRELAMGRPPKLPLVGAATAALLLVATCLPLPISYFFSVPQSMIVIKSVPDCAAENPFDELFAPGKSIVENEFFMFDVYWMLGGFPVLTSFFDVANGWRCERILSCVLGTVIVFFDN